MSWLQTSTSSICSSKYNHLLYPKEETSNYHHHYNYLASFPLKNCWNCWAPSNEGNYFINKSENTVKRRKRETRKVKIKQKTNLLKNNAFNEKFSRKLEKGKKERKKEKYAKLQASYFQKYVNIVKPWNYYFHSRRRITEANWNTQRKLKLVFKFFIIRKRVFKFWQEEHVSQVVKTATTNYSTLRHVWGVC